MTITGKKFSQLTDEQKKSTRVPITGWMVNNLFINPDQIPVYKLSDANMSLVGDGPAIFLIDSGLTQDVLISYSEQTSTPVGSKSYLVNWDKKRTRIIADEGITLLPYADIFADNLFGVFQLEKTNEDEWTLSVIENSYIQEYDGGLA